MVIFNDIMQGFQGFHSSLSATLFWMQTHVRRIFVRYFPQKQHKKQSISFKTQNLLFPHWWQALVQPPFFPLPSAFAWYEIHSAAWVIWHMWTITNFIWADLLSECPRQQGSPRGRGGWQESGSQMQNPNSFFFFYHLDIVTYIFFFWCSSLLQKKPNRPHAKININFLNKIHFHYNWFQAIGGTLFATVGQT